MFGLFKKASPAALVSAEPDLVYVDDATRVDAVAKELQTLAARRVALAVLTPFRDHADVARELLAARGVATASLDQTYRDAAPAKGAIYLLECARVPELLARTTGPLRCLQMERHPLRRHDDAVDAALGAHSIEHRVRRYLSLDDGLFAIFDTAGTVRQMFATLGIESGEPIEHALVTKSIARAQEKIAKKVREERLANSFAEWRAVNSLAPRE